MLLKSFIRLCKLLKFLFHACICFLWRRYLWWVCRCSKFLLKQYQDICFQESFCPIHAAKSTWDVQYNRGYHAISICSILLRFRYQSCLPKRRCHWVHYKVDGLTHLQQIHFKLLQVFSFSCRSFVAFSQYVIMVIKCPSSDVSFLQFQLLLQNKGNVEVKLFQWIFCLGCQILRIYLDSQASDMWRDHLNW